MMITDRKLILVTRPTRLQELIQRYGTKGQAEFYLKHLGESFDYYQEEHRLFMQAYDSVVEKLKGTGRLQVLDRRFLPTYQFSDDDIVVVLGQDGLVANTLKYLSGQPVIAINPMPTTYDGILLPFKVGDLTGVLKSLLLNRSTIKSIKMAQATTNRGQSLLAVNDLFIGPASHSSARYEIVSGNQRERQSSSGVIISTGLGSTGWFKSILAGAAGIAGVAVSSKLSQGFAWDSDFLYFSVREPFPSKTTGTNLVFGKVDSAHPLTLQSNMADNGVIFSDGIENDRIDFTAGTLVNIGISKSVGQLVV
ncbi:sugar kinase [Limnobaculum zhutongyuii]|uniref:Sugar kinase n=2 Tax=Limnobaculum zhutongyuii TaxID=2498113 RepID=A0A411WPI8_9GAMM|nr:sugar kinase [Limnobaculum zhutongyuii]TQS86363.1 sugar kinase [Limnobaculum zhutongyuii]